MEAEKKEELRKQSKNKFALSQEKFRSSKTAYLLGKSQIASRGSVFAPKEKAKQVLRVPALNELPKKRLDDYEKDPSESFEALSAVPDLSQGEYLSSVFLFELSLIYDFVCNNKKSNCLRAVFFLAVHYTGDSLVAFKRVIHICYDVNYG